MRRFVWIVSHRGVVRPLVVGACLWLAGSLSMALAAPSPNGPWVVRDLGNGHAVIAGFKTHVGTQDLLALERAWGPADRLSLRVGECRAIWDVPAVRVNLRSLGVPPDGLTYCSPGGGWISSIHTKSTRWRTERGLKVGDPRSRLRKLYPTSFRRPPLARHQWGLRAFTASVLGEPETVSGVYARMVDGRISSYLADIGAEGE